MRSPCLHGLRVTKTLSLAAHLSQDSSLSLSLSPDASSQFRTDSKAQMFCCLNCNRALDRINRLRQGSTKLFQACLAIAMTVPNSNERENDHLRSKKTRTCSSVRRISKNLISKQLG